MTGTAYEATQLERLRDALVGQSMLAINNKTMLIATSRGDIVKIFQTFLSLDFVGTAFMNKESSLYLNREVCNVRFTHTLLARFSGAKTWSVSLDVQLNDADFGGWYSLAVSSLKSTSGSVAPEPLGWVHEVSVRPGLGILILAKQDAEDVV